MPYFAPVLVEPLRARSGRPRAAPRSARRDRSASALRLAGMIDMAVRQQDLLDRDAGLRDRRLDARQVAAGIDHRRLHRRGAPDERAILLERRDGDDRGAERRVGLGHAAEIGSAPAIGAIAACGLPAARPVHLRDGCCDRALRAARRRPRRAARRARLYRDPVGSSTRRHARRGRARARRAARRARARAARRRLPDLRGGRGARAGAGAVGRAATARCSGSACSTSYDDRARRRRRAAARSRRRLGRRAAAADRPRRPMTPRSRACSTLIAAGDIYQANLTFARRGAVRGRSARALRPAARAARRRAMARWSTTGERLAAVALARTVLRARRRRAHLPADEGHRAARRHARRGPRARRRRSPPTPSSAPKI